MAIVKDTTGEIEEGSIYLPKSKTVPIGKPVVGVAIAALKEELAEVYGDRFEVQEEGQEQEQEQPTSEAKPPRRKPSTEEKPTE